MKCNFNLKQSNFIYFKKDKKLQIINLSLLQLLNYDQILLPELQKWESAPLPLSKETSEKSVAVRNGWRNDGRGALLFPGETLEKMKFREFGALGFYDIRGSTCWTSWELGVTNFSSSFSDWVRG
ncbi:hypothetical protein TNCT_509751 [Trichonephila clavata]|uniref:Uncharacterized protein n=1 Tax=Trichonephila clavata TaxID=2740835 RepID=A0A8X6G1U7_TRICU|nr:hypothetical protein TNCT_509751 [Trichonephila clavata]